MFLPFSGQHQRADPTRTRLIQHVMTKYKMKVTFTYMIHKTLKKKKKGKSTKIRSHWLNSSSWQLSWRSSDKVWNSFGYFTWKISGFFAVLFSLVLKWAGLSRKRGHVLLCTNQDLVTSVSECDDTWWVVWSLSMKSNQTWESLIYKTQRSTSNSYSRSNTIIKTVNSQRRGARQTSVVHIRLLRTASRTLWSTGMKQTSPQQMKTQKWRQLS